MRAVMYYPKMMIKKLLSSVALVGLVALKKLLKVTQFVYKLFAIPFIFFCGVYGASFFWGTPVSDVLIALGLATCALTVYMLLPVVLSKMDSGIDRFMQVARRPLWIRSRLKYTLD